MPYILMMFFFLLVSSTVLSHENAEELKRVECDEVDIKEVSNEQKKYFQRYLDQRKARKLSTYYVSFGVNKQGEIKKMFFHLCYSPNDEDLKFALSIPSIDEIYLDMNLISDEVMQEVIKKTSKANIFFATFSDKDKKDRKTSKPFIRLSDEEFVKRWATK